jgi:hypothetical protein
MWLRITYVLVLGYLSISRTFAYIGIPGWNIFISEVTLLLLLFAGPKLKDKSWISVTLKLPALKPFWAWYILFLVYGIMHVLYGIHQGYPALTASRDLAFNYYPLYFVLGLGQACYGRTTCPGLSAALPGSMEYLGSSSFSFLIVLSGLFRGLVKKLYVFRFLVSPFIPS